MLDLDFEPTLRRHGGRPSQIQPARWSEARHEVGIPPFGGRGEIRRGIEVCRSLTLAEGIVPPRLEVGVLTSQCEFFHLDAIDMCIRPQN